MKDSLPTDLLGWLLSPLSTQNFIQEYWGQKPLLLQRKNTPYYSPLLTDSDLDYVLHAAMRRRGNVEILSGDGRPQSVGGVEGAVRSVRQGLSLRVNAIQRFSPALAMVRSALEQRFSCTVNINMYLTPGDGKALGKHLDTHDVLVVQIGGRKHWQLFDGGSVDPLEYLPQLRGESKPYQKKFRLTNPQGAAESNVTHDFRLEAGDLLYLPRGYQHAAQGELGTVSCHLTIGFQVLTYLDMLTVALASASSQLPALRKSLPAGFSWAPEAQAAAVGEAEKIVAQLTSALQPESAFRELGRLYTRGRDQLTTNRLLRPRTASDEIELETRLQKRTGITLGIDREGENIRLMWRETALTLPARLDAACRFLIENTQFRPSEITAEISDEEKLAFCRDLAELNLLFPAGRMRRPGAGMLSPGMSGWLPIDYDVRERVLTWQFFDHRPLGEPFFRQSVRKAQSDYPNRQRRRTRLAQFSPNTEGTRLAGFIFHISRCGSTLVSNALRSLGDVHIVSEAEPVNQAVAALRHARESGDRGQIEFAQGSLRKIVEIFCAYGSRPLPTVFKLTSWNILEITEFRGLWPEVPFVVVVRAPEQVVVSCLGTPPGWMNWKDRPGQGDKTAIDSGRSDAMQEEFCARMLGQFMQCALAVCDDRTMVVNYAELNTGKLSEIAAHFGLEVNAAQLEQMQQSLTYYSKDPTVSRVFTSDEAEKNAAITATIQTASETWAQGPYEELCKRS